MKTIKVSSETHDKLTTIGKWGETMDSIIDKCVEAYFQAHKISSKRLVTS